MHGVTQARQRLGIIREHVSKAPTVLHIGDLERMNRKGRRIPRAVERKPLASQHGAICNPLLWYERVETPDKTPTGYWVPTQFTFRPARFLEQLIDVFLYQSHGLPPLFE